MSNPDWVAQILAMTTDELAANNGAATVTDTLPLLLPTVPGKAHGIVSVDPPTVQCDGCAATYTGRTLARAVIDSEYHFNPRREHDRRRLCRDCAKDAGWGR